MGDLPEFALSVRQPWAWAIIHAGKDVENRNWPTGGTDRIRRGPIAIHASKGMTRGEYVSACMAMEQIGVECPPARTLERGGIIGSVTIVDVVLGHRSPWRASHLGLVGLVLADPKPCEFIPAKGQLGFFRWTKASTSSVPRPARWMMPKEPQIVDFVISWSVS